MRNAALLLFFCGIQFSAAHAKKVAVQVGLSSPKGKSYQNFHDQLFREVSTGLKMQIAKKLTQSYELASNATRFESPWTLTTDTSVVAYESDPLVGQTAPIKFSTLYGSRDGYQATINANLFNRSATNYGHIVPFQGDFTIGKDISRGGPHSPRFIEAEIKRNDSRVKYLLVEDRYLSDLLKLEAMAIGYFNLSCRLSDFEATRASFREIVDAAEIKTSAKAMSLKELLILKDSDYVLSRRYKDLQLKRDDYLIDFLEYGEKAQEIVKELRSIPVLCLDPNEIEISKNEALAKKMTGIARLAASVLAIETKAEGQKKTADLLRADLKSSIVPYVGVNTYSDVPSNYNRAEAVIGLRFTYNFSGQDKSLEIRSALEQRTALLDQTRQAELTERREVEHLLRAIVRSSEYLQTAKLILANSRNLLRVIKVQLDLGLLDSTTTGQAYLNYSDSLLGLRDIWETATLAEYQLNQIWLAKSRVKDELSGGLKDTN